MRETLPQAAPRAYVSFCVNNSDQCAPNGAHGRIQLTAETWQLIREVNRAVNTRITPDPTKGAYDWSLVAASGNCNDYAVQKRKALIDRGLPASALSLSVVLTRRGVGHLVLTVRTDRGDYVLDNLRRAIVAWDRTGYRFNRVQSVDNPQSWVLPQVDNTHQRSL
ncbi:MAG: transglutaminase-like cysteine peptidase [Ancalomicrobiaceae bacterium]|nr:transglutaminase-like cysteine peptidase [Ancalomicrobiaceae bacterium]